MRRYSLELPIYYTIEKKTKKNQTVLVGQNWHRNIHYYLKNKVKQHYHELVKNQLDYIDETDKLERYTMRLKLYYKSSTCDMMNVCSMIEKFVSDGLKECGLIKDDNVKLFSRCVIEVVEQDKDNPRVEITIEERAN